jgi:trimethylamine--corrinoid protein Co-methyltransferase
MARPVISLLNPSEVERIRETSLRVLREVGVLVHQAEVLDRLASAGAKVDGDRRIARFDEDMVMGAVASAGKQYVLHGRGATTVARFGYGDQNLISSPGQFGWFDETGARRSPLLADSQAAIRLGDALPNVTIVGAMCAPADVPTQIRDVVLTAELVKGTTKPTRCWPVTRRSSHHVLEIYKLIAGGEAELRQRPMTEMFLEPISPLQLPETGLDVLLEFLEYGQPVSIGPMTMASGTGPATLAGSLAQENAEILAGVVVAQTIRPGTPILYGGIPHIMDQRTSICSFGSPEQGLMAIAMTQIGKSYGFPVYINVNLTDAKLLDAQAGMEKMGSLISGMLAGADLFGHAGIVGTDHGGSLLWLVMDDEAMAYARRVYRGFEVDGEALAAEVIAEVGPGGNYLSHEHTVRHFRKELWFPDAVWQRAPYDIWVAAGGTSVADRALKRQRDLLEKHQPEPLDPKLAQEVDRIVEAARRELIG